MPCRDSAGCLCRRHGLAIVPLLVVGLCWLSKYLCAEGLEAPWLWPGGERGPEEASEASWGGDPVTGPRGSEGV